MAGPPRNEPVNDRPTRCEICGDTLADWVLAPGQILDRCGACGHLRRDLERCPAGHRDAAWGGEVQLDRVRLALTYRRIRARASSVGAGQLRVFEAGYGSAGLLRRFLDDGAQVAGTDPGALGTAVDPVVARTGGLLTVPVDDVTEGLGTYDLVLAVHVIEHVPDPWAFVRSCRQLARADGGRVLFVTPAGDSTSLARSGPSWWMLEDPTHVRFFSSTSLGLLLARSGLTVLEVTRPVADSLSVEAASRVRRRHASAAPAAGVLADRSTRLLAAVALPAVLPMRWLAPARRPSLQAVATRA